MFGYGSLMWRPGFDFLESHPALLRGYHRAFCVYSTEYRGTPRRPGLVLGLERGGACRGLAFRVAGRAAAETRADLREREKPKDLYRERLVPVFVCGLRRLALTFTVDRSHPRYAARLGFAQQVALIRAGIGETGRNRDYLSATVRRLAELGHRDPALARLHEAVETPA